MSSRNLSDIFYSIAVPSAMATTTFCAAIATSIPAGQAFFAVATGLSVGWGCYEAASTLARAAETAENPRAIKSEAPRQSENGGGGQDGPL